jgi:hypothetical protein
MRIVIYIFTLLVVSSPAKALEIVSADFIEPTTRYDHCVLGDCIEYGGLKVTLDDQTTQDYILPETDVFEDVNPRLIPMGLNGRMAVLTVVSNHDGGARLVLLDLRHDKLDIVAKSDPIGLSHRWQNPIGAGDFDHDGIMEIASVITPHIGGTLQLFERRGAKLVADKQAKSFSNHQIGSSILDLHEIMDWDKDEVIDIILPDVSRTKLLVISFAEGVAKLIAERDMVQKIKGPVLFKDDGLQTTLSDGSIDLWYP